MKINQTIVNRELGQTYIDDRGVRRAGDNMANFVQSVGKPAFLLTTKPASEIGTTDTRIDQAIPSSPRVGILCGSSSLSACGLVVLRSFDLAVLLVALGWPGQAGQMGEVIYCMMYSTVSARSFLP